MEQTKEIAKELVIEFRAKIEEYPSDYPPELEYLVAKRCAILCAQIAIDSKDWEIKDWEDILSNLQKL